MTNQHNRLASNRLGVPGIVFMVLAAVAPLTGVVVISVLGIGLGNGGGMVGSFLLVTLVLSLFAVGYAQMSKETVSAGGFYAFAVKGLGRPAGLSTGFVAVLGYNCFVAGAVGTVGFFFQTIVAQLTGFNLAWFWWGLIIVAIAFALTTRGIEVSAKLLGVSLVLEVAILIVFDFSVLFTSGSVLKPSLLRHYSQDRSALGFCSLLQHSSDSKPPGCSARKPRTRPAPSRAQPL